MLSLTMFTEEELDGIVDDAFALLERVGVAVGDEASVELFADHGATVTGEGETRRVIFTRELIEDALGKARSVVTLYDRDGRETAMLGGSQVHFNPGSAAIRVLDAASGVLKSPTTEDYIRFTRVVDALPNMTSQSTSIIPADVPHEMADAYRLAIALIFGTKPVVTGTFGPEGRGPMLDMLTAVRGSEDALERMPLAVFDCCPTPPLVLSAERCRELVALARAGIPIETISMPQPGISAPLRLRSVVVQHAAETMATVALVELTRPGAPVIYGGSPTTMELKRCASLLGAPETCLMASYTQVGKRYGLPTHTYLGLSDAKQLDMQAGSEYAMGALAATLLGVNNVSGPGMLDCESAQSIEGVVIADTIIAAVRRFVRGVDAGRDEDSIEGFRYLVEHGLPDPDDALHVLRETDEFTDLGPIMERSTLEDWERRGRRSIIDRAREKIDAVLAGPGPEPLAEDVIREILRILSTAWPDVELPLMRFLEG